MGPFKLSSLFLRLESKVTKNYGVSGNTSSFVTTIRMFAATTNIIDINEVYVTLSIMMLGIVINGVPVIIVTIFTTSVCYVIFLIIIMVIFL